MSGQVIGKLYALVGADTSDFTRKMTGVSSMAKSVGRGMSLALTAPLLILAGAAVKTAATFEQTLMNAFSVTGSKSIEVKDDMEDLARSMGKSTVFSANEAAEAMYFMASAGWDAKKMAVGLEDTLNLAAATQNDLAFSTETVVSTLNQFGLQASDAGMVADVFANAISGSQATLDRLKISMGYVGPIAKSLNYSLEDTTAALSMLYSKGIDASTAGTGLRMSLAKLLDPTNKTAGGLKRLGIATEEVNPATKSLADIVGVLEGKAMTASDAIRIFGVRAGPTMLNLVAVGREELEKFSGTLDESGRAAEMAEMQLNTLSGQWKLFRSALSEVAIQVGKILIPILRDFINKGLMPMVQGFGNLSDKTKKVIVTIAAVLAAIGPLLMIFSKIALILPILVKSTIAWGTALKMAAGPLGIIAAASIVAYKGLSKLIKAKSDLVDADYKAFEAQKKFGQKLREAADAAGMTRREFVKLEMAYNGNTTALANAIRKGKHGVELQKSLAEVGKKHREEIEKITGAEEDAIGPGEAFRDINAEIKAAIEEVTAAEKAADLAAKEWAETMDALGLKTIPEKATEVRNLEGDLKKLHQMYKDGLLDLDDYKGAVEEIEGKIKELSTTMGTTAIPAARDFGTAIEDAMDGSISKTQEFAGAVETETENVKTQWDEMADGLQTKWASSFGDILRGTATFKDALNGIWGSIKDQFFDMVGQMVAKWTFALITDLAGAAKSGAAAVGETLGSAVKETGASIASLGTGLISLIPALATAIASAATILAAAAPAILTVGAIALGLFAGFKLISGLLSKGKGGQELRAIKDNTWEMKMDLRNMVNNQDFIKEKIAWSWGELTTINAQLNSIKLNGITITANVHQIKETLWRTNKILRTKLKSIVGFLSGDGKDGEGKKPGIPGLTGGGDGPVADTAAAEAAGAGYVGQPQPAGEWYNGDGQVT